MKALILAAGRGSRMGEFTEERPKGLVQLRGKSLLERQLTAIREAGITDIGIITGYRHELLDAFGLPTFHNERWAETNMVSSLARAHGWLAKNQCIVSYSDIFYTADAIRLLIEDPREIAITYDPNWQTLWAARFHNPLDDAETFRVNAHGILQEIGNKPNTISEVEGQYMGLIKFTPTAWTEAVRLIEMMPNNTADQMQMTKLLQHFIEARQLVVSAIPYTGNWGEVDSAEDLTLYERTSNIVG